MTLQEQFEKETGEYRPYASDFLNIGEYKSAIKEWKEKYIKWLEKRVPQWIGVNQELPEKEKYSEFESITVLVRWVGSDIAETGFFMFNKNKWFIQSRHRIANFHDVVCWMKLPEADNYVSYTKDTQ